MAIFKVAAYGRQQQRIHRIRYGNEGAGRPPERRRHQCQGPGVLDDGTALHRFTDLSYYETVSVVPTDDVESLKLALCYIWLALVSTSTGAALSKGKAKREGKRHVHKISTFCALRCG